MPLDSESVEVVIPLRGTVPWFSLSLSSIAAQTLQPISVTVVDDGVEAPDFIHNLGVRLFANRFQLLKNPGRGISAALNAAIAQSRADWIARMDADDIAHPDRLKKQLNFLATQPDCVVGSGTQVRFVNAKGNALALSHLPTTWQEISQAIHSRTCFIHSSLVVRRDVLLTIPYRPCMDGAEDVDLILRLAEKGEMLNLNDALLEYRLHATQESFRARARHTAVQELAFRLARSRWAKKVDPLESAPDLAERFIRWRLSDPAYVRSRTFLTALRYAKTYLAGFDLEGFSRMAVIGLKSFPISWPSLHISWLVSRKAGAALLEQKTPFAELNLR